MRGTASRKASLDGLKAGTQATVRYDGSLHCLILDETAIAVTQASDSTGNALKVQPSRAQSPRSPRLASISIHKSVRLKEIELLQAAENGKLEVVHKLVRPPGLLRGPTFTCTAYQRSHTHVRSCPRYGTTVLIFTVWMTEATPW